MVDRYPRTVPELTAPGRTFAIITPSDDEDLAIVPRAIALPAAGALRITALDGTVVTIPDGCLAPGVLHPIRPVKIWATGTTVVGNILAVD